MAYLLDANVFIEAKNRHYGLDFCPAFWDWLIDENLAGRVFSTKFTEEELLKGSDELAKWAGCRGPEFFLAADAATLSALPSVSLWAYSRHYTGTAVSEFLASADYYLVAHALGHGHTVVTHERADSNAKRIKIPNACGGLGVACVSPFEMLRAAGARFVLGG